MQAYSSNQRLNREMDGGDADQNDGENIQENDFIKEDSQEDFSELKAPSKANFDNKDGSNTNVNSQGKEEEKVDRTDLYNTKVPEDQAAKMRK